VSVFLGDRWFAAAAPLRIFAFAFPLTIVAAPFPSLYLALGRPRLGFWMGLAAAPFLFAAIFAGLAGGAVGAATGVALVMLGIAVAHFYVAGRLVGISIPQFIRPLVFPALCSSVAFALAEAANLIIETGFPYYRLFIQGGTFLVFYGAAVGFKEMRRNKILNVLPEPMT
jgi:O-antigen/teichoic acid export membrane protein